MRDRYALLQRGLFPETLPPCFTSLDLKRAMRGAVTAIRSREFFKRSADYIRYNGTKHDGNRRYFATPNPIAYFYVADFVAANWNVFDNKYQSSPLSVSRPKLAQLTDDRAIIIPSLSQLATEASQNIGFSPYVLKTDIAQFFPSIYTHSIPWAAHGIQASKDDQSPQSNALPFNRLDFFVRNCQSTETRGLLVGPDAFRLIAEFISAEIDDALQQSVGTYIVGAARHVDDYFIGLRSETDAFVVLSALRDILQRYNLNINDTKTKIISGLEPLNELWAQNLRKESRELRDWPGATTENVILFITKALDLAATLKSDSPVKIAIRTLDQLKAYSKTWWDVIEPYLQRILFHHPHCIDYVALLVVKRVAIGEDIDRDGWTASVIDLLKRHLAFNHHHEVVWLSWLLLAVGIPMPETLVEQLCRNPNAHIRALVLAAFAEKRIDRKPSLRLGSRLASNDSSWLTNLVARSSGYTKASFSGPYSSEFEQLASRNVMLIDIKAHTEALEIQNSHAISRTRYGYDSDDEDDDDNPFMGFGGAGFHDADDD